MGKYKGSEDHSNVYTIIKNRDELVEGMIAFSKS